MWFQQPDAFTHVQFPLECGPDHLLKCFERSDLYYKTHAGLAKFQNSDFASPGMK